MLIHDDRPGNSSAHPHPLEETPSHQTRFPACTIISPHTTPDDHSTSAPAL